MDDVLAAVLAALMGGPRQHGRLLTLTTSLGPDVLVAEAFDGVESLDRGGFRFVLKALAVDAYLDPAQLLGQPVLLELLTADAIDGLRPFHGHVSAFARLGSNGGLARYELVIQPWLAFLRQRVDSYVFQDMTVVEVVESVFADYAAKQVPLGGAAKQVPLEGATKQVPVEGPGNGRLVPAWRWDLKDPSVYRKRSLVTQYEEDDLAFVERLLAEEGIHYHFEHRGDPGSESLGAHALVLADHNDAFAAIGSVRYHRADVTEQADSIQRWAVRKQWQPLLLTRASWDHRRLDLRPVEAGAPAGQIAVEDSDCAGPYAYPDRATGERYARQHLEALTVDGDTVPGAGTWRRLRPGGRFELTQHTGNASGGRFLCVRVHHRARNNLDAEVIAQIEKTLGRGDLPMLSMPAAFERVAVTAGRRLDAAPSTAAAASGVAAAAGVAFYQNTFQAMPEAAPYRSQTQDGHGLRLHPRPTVHGTQTAIVVGDGAPLSLKGTSCGAHTDRDHRIKLQFPWQRGGNASNRLGHPSGDDNAPATAGAWTWVRVIGAWAGDNWGSVMLPRPGQEVLVAFLEGDIDRPVVIGAVYNGRGQIDAAHNQVTGGCAGATGNAPAWFDGNAHAAVFTGFKTQALADSRSGSGGYQQLRLDDTPGQGRAQASTTQHESTLTLGHLKGGRDNIRGAERGFGVELSTRAGGALRAGAGLLLTTEPGQQQLAASGAQGQLAQSQQLVASLFGAARNQSADFPDETNELPAHAALTRLQQTLQATSTGRASSNGIGGGGSVASWSSPVILATSPDGIASVTPADQVWVSGTQAVVCADHDLQWISQGETVITVAGGIALYTQGSDAPAGKPNQETGIALHAAQGAVSVRAHANLARVAAQASVTIASTQADVSVAASKHILLTAAGAYLKMEGGNIELGAPGRIEFKASKKEWTGPKSASAELPELPKTEGNFVQSFALYSLEGVGLDGAEITLFDPQKRETLWTASIPSSGEVTAEVKDKGQGYIALVGYDAWSFGFDDLDESGDGEDDDDGVAFSDEDDREEEARMRGEHHVG